jgi:hypothetical protein
MMNYLSSRAVKVLINTMAFIKEELKQKPSIQDGIDFSKLNTKLNIDFTTKQLNELSALGVTIENKKKISDVVDDTKIQTSINKVLGINISKDNFTMEELIDSNLTTDQLIELFGSNLTADQLLYKRCFDIDRFLQSYSFLDRIKNWWKSVLVSDTNEYENFVIDINAIQNLPKARNFIYTKDLTSLNLNITSGGYHFGVGKQIQFIMLCSNWSIWPWVFKYYERIENNAIVKSIFGNKETFQANLIKHFQPSNKRNLLIMFFLFCSICSIPGLNIAILSFWAMSLLTLLVLFVYFKMVDPFFKNNSFLTQNTCLTTNSNPNRPNNNFTPRSPLPRVQNTNQPNSPSSSLSSNQPNGPSSSRGLSN